MKNTNNISSTVLSCVAALGVVVTAVTVGKATPKALNKIKADSRRNHDGDPYAYTNKEAIQSAWKFYIPSVVAGTTTIVCIFGANMLSRRQQAAITSAYGLLNSSYQEYKDKLKELYGEEAHQKIIDAIAAEKAEDIYISASGALGGSSLSFEERDPDSVRLFYDSFSKRYFESSVPQVLEAEYHLNRNRSLGMEVSVNDFYEFLGIELIDGGYELRWSWSDEIGWIDFSHRKTVLDDGLEVYIIDFVWFPRLSNGDDDY